MTMSHVVTFTLVMQLPDAVDPTTELTVGRITILGCGRVQARADELVFVSVQDGVGIDAQAAGADPSSWPTD